MPGNDYGGAKKKRSRREAFLKTCAPATAEIHAPILDLHKTRGHLNPSGLGGAFRFPALGQSTIAFDSIADYDAANAGHSPYGGAEYGVVESPVAADLCRRFNDLHGGQGAVIVPSGLNAIATAIDAFVPAGGTVLVPANCYSPAIRLIEEMKKKDPDVISYEQYGARVTGAEMSALLEKLAANGKKIDLLYIEAPGSLTYEIPDIDGIIAAARRRGIRTLVDNSWGSHVRFRPLAHGADIALQATTKYEGGYGDTPSGVLIAGNEADYKLLARRLRVFGNGAVAPETCARLLQRLQSTEERLDRQTATAKALGDWLAGQDFIEEVLNPARPESPDHARLLQYFGDGNGLLTAVFRNDVTSEKVNEFLDRLLLPRIGESWATHVTLALPVKPDRADDLDRKAGPMVRFSAGLEDADDLIRDLWQASAEIFPVHKTSIHKAAAHKIVRQFSPDPVF